MRQAEEISTVTEDSRKERLKNLLKEKSYLHGDFTLSSGEKSDVFFDVKRTTLNPEGASLAGDLMLERIMEAGEVAAVGGLVIGACPIVSAICLRSALHGRPLPAFYVRKEPKLHGTKNQIEGLDLKAGDKVAIVDDVATKGGSMIDAIREVEKLGCRVVKTIVIVDREQGAGERLKAAGYTLESIFKRRDIE